MKVFLDFLPVTLFFVVYKMADKTRDILNAFLPESASVWLADQSDFILATLFLIPATLIPILYVWQKEHRIEKMHVITFAIVLLMGGLTIALDSPVFLKWKPSIVSWAFGLVFGISLLFNRNLLQKLLGDQITLPDAVWTRLTLFWIGYFFITG
ncbi:MAG: septation protein IspZ, partial [Pseudomonadota bacterium]|nr:septation protein IspZ [Pseudomonadota bacterium]